MKDPLKTCFAHLKENELHLGNHAFERRWQIKNGLLYATSFKDLVTQKEWLAKPSATPSPYPALETLPQEEMKVSLACQHMHPTPVSTEAFEAILTAKGNHLTFIYRFLIYPQTSGVATQLTVLGASAFLETPDTEAKAIINPVDDEKDLIIDQNHALPACDCLEHFNLAPQHLRLTHVSFKDVTDIHNNLVMENHWLLHPNEPQISLSGNLFYIEDTLTNSGLIFLKQTPLPHARPVKNKVDFRVHGRANYSSKVKVAEFNEQHPRYPLAYQIGLFGHGMDVSTPTSYYWVVLTYDNGQHGRTKVLHQYQNQWRPFLSRRDGQIISNTWGDRSMNSRVSEDFLLKEIRTCSELGIDVMQIDDGWQRGLDTGTTSGSTDLWQNIWAASSQYWQPHPKRLPHGLGSIVAEGKKKGVSIGIWYVVDPCDHYANWKSDLKQLLEIHNEHGINYFKFDGVLIASREGEKNFHQLVTELQKQSHNQIVIDLDVTAGVRQGYFGMLENGPLFVENRYTDWHGYWPHQTLRNLWSLAQFINPIRLRFEFLNNTRNLPFYQNDPLSPSQYECDYLFATVMFCSSLAWFETQHYPRQSSNKVAKLIKIWKKHREKVLQGELYPIGAQPDGTTWTGFCSIAPNNESIHILIFREKNLSTTHTFEIPAAALDTFAVKKLAGQGSAKIRKGELSVKIAEPLNYLFLQCSKK